MAGLGMGAGMGAPGVWPITPWTYPEVRYYDDWMDTQPPTTPTSDHEIKSLVVERLKTNTYTKHDDIKVDVKQRVVVLGGDVSSWRVKRSAGDDAWDTPGVVDVSNQLVVPRESE